MKKLISIVILLVTITTAQAITIDERVSTLEDQVIILDRPITINNNTYNISNTDSKLYRKLIATTAALSSVELNPDHLGWSVSLGLASYHGEGGAAVGIMYAMPSSIKGITIGFNAKTFRTPQGTSGYSVGTSAGITIGF